LDFFTDHRSSAETGKYLHINIGMRIILALKIMIFNGLIENKQKCLNYLLDRAANGSLSQAFLTICIFFTKKRKGIHIKNKFYTRVRRAIRQINGGIDFNFSKKYSRFNFSVISKLVYLISKSS